MSRPLKRARRVGMSAILAENPASQVERGVNYGTTLRVVALVMRNHDSPESCHTGHLGANSPASFSNCGSFAMNLAGLALKAFGQFGQQK